MFRASLGLNNNYGRIATFGPLSDLTDANNVALMRVYIDYYTNQGYKTRPQSIGGLITGKDLVSPAKSPTSTTGTSFFIGHGTLDNLTPPSQSKAFYDKNPAKTTLCGVSSGHTLFDPYGSSTDFSALNYMVAKIMSFFSSGVASTSNCLSIQ